MNDKSVTQRQAKIKLLLDERERLHPSESYDERYSAVMSSCEGQQLSGEMHIANTEAVPVFSPRTAAIIGLRYPQDRAIYPERWVRRYGPVSANPPEPAYPSEQESLRKTAAAAGRITDEPKVKEEGRREFLAEVTRLMGLGHGYDQSWAIAGATEPGKSAYLKWLAGAAQLKSSA